MVPRFEPDLRLIAQALINYRWHAVPGPERRHSPNPAIREEPGYLMFSREPLRSSNRGQIKPMRTRRDDQCETLLAVQHHRLCQSIARHVRGFSRLTARLCVGMCGHSMDNARELELLFDRRGDCHWYALRVKRNSCNVIWFWGLTAVKPRTVGAVLHNQAGGNARVDPSAGAPHSGGE
jgi:hypothetical protein